MNQMQDFYRYFDIIKRSWRLIAIMTVAFAVVSGLVVYHMPLYYRSTTLILVEKQQIPEAYVTPTDTTPFSQRLNTIRQQILSRQKLEKIISDFNLYSDLRLVHPLYAIMGTFGIKTDKKPMKEEVLNWMTEDISISVIGSKQSDDAFSITYTGTDPQVTMQVTNTLASLFIEENLKAREQYAEGTSDFLNNELESAKKELETQERALRSYKEKYMGGLPQQLDANLRTLDRLQTDFQSVNSEIKSAEDRLLVLSTQLSQSDSTSATPGTNPLVEELRRRQGELATLLSTYRENYPDVIATKKRINELKALLENSKQNTGSVEAKLLELKPEDRNPELYNAITALKAQITTLNHRKDSIRKQINVFEKYVEQTPANEQRMADLNRDYSISLRNYQALLEKKLSARLAENLEKRQKGERFNVIDPANLPEAPYKPNKMLIVAGSTAAGLGCGFLIALLLDFMHPTFRKPEELLEVQDSPILAIIPLFGPNDGNAKQKRSRRRQPGAQENAV